MLSYYGSFNTFLAHRPSETDKYLIEKDPVDRLGYNTSLDEMERFLTKGRKKWITLGEAINRLFPPKDDK